MCPSPFSRAKTLARPYQHVSCHYERYLVKGINYDLSHFGITSTL